MQQQQKVLKENIQQFSLYFVVTFKELELVDGSLSRSNCPASLNLAAPAIHPIVSSKSRAAIPPCNILVWPEVPLLHCTTTT